MNRHKSVCNTRPLRRRDTRGCGLESFLRKPRQSSLENLNPSFRASPHGEAKKSSPILAMKALDGAYRLEPLPRFCASSSEINQDAVRVLRERVSSNIEEENRRTSFSYDKRSTVAENAVRDPAARHAIDSPVFREAEMAMHIEHRITHRKMSCFDSEASRPCARRRRTGADESPDEEDLPEVEPPMPPVRPESVLPRSPELSVDDPSLSCPLVASPDDVPCWLRGPTSRRRRIRPRRSRRILFIRRRSLFGSARRSIYPWNGLPGILAFAPP